MTLVARASGTPPFAFSWAADGGGIAGAAGASLVLSNVQPGASGVYTVTVSNAWGVSSASATVEVSDPVYDPPVITLDPLSQTRPLGGTANLRVDAAGTAPLLFQWFKNSQPVASGTNALLSLNPLAAGDTGDYYAVAANGGGAATSRVARLVVEVPAPPVITGAPADTNVVYGSTVELWASATGEEPLSYLWRKGGQPVVLGSYASNSAVYYVYATGPVFRQTNYTGAGLGAPYDVVASNRWGMATSAPPAWIHVYSSGAPFVSSGGGFTNAPGGTARFEFVSADMPPFAWGGAAKRRSAGRGAGGLRIAVQQRQRA